MVITVKNLLKVLPIDNITRENILSKYDTMTSDQQLDIKEYCWRMYFTLLKSQIKYELDEALLEVQEEKIGLSKNIYKEIEQKVTKEFEQKFMQVEEFANIEKVRQELQQIMTRSKSPSPSPTQKPFAPTQDHPSTSSG